MKQDSKAIVLLQIYILKRKIQDTFYKNCSLWEEKKCKKNHLLHWVLHISSHCCLQLQKLLCERPEILSAFMSKILSTAIKTRIWYLQQRILWIQAVFWMLNGSCILAKNFDAKQNLMYNVLTKSCFTWNIEYLVSEWVSVRVSDAKSLVSDKTGKA